LVTIHKDCENRRIFLPNFDLRRNLNSRITTSVTAPEGPIRPICAKTFFQLRAPSCVATQLLGAATNGTQIALYDTG
jgi:hypothetical protein